MLFLFYLYSENDELLVYKSLTLSYRNLEKREGHLIRKRKQF